METSGSKKILIFRPGAIGDVVHTIVIAKAIKEKHPDYTVHYLTQSGIAPMLENNPYIDKVHMFVRSDRNSLKYTLDVINTLRNEKYDVIFNLTNSLRNILISVLSFPKKLVFRKKYGGLWVEDFFLTAKWAIPDIELPKTLELGVIESDLEAVTELLSDYPSPYVMIIPGGATDKNRQGRIWSIEKWSVLSRDILNKYGGTVFVMGSKGERAYHEQLASEGVVITSGEYSLAGSSALLSKSDLVISGDTGTLHIASAHGVNTLAILGSTSPDKIKPYGDRGFYISADTECKYCWEKRCKHLKSGEKYTPCMEKVTPDMIMDKIESEKLL